MPVLRQILIVACLLAVAVAGYLFQSTNFSIGGTTASGSGTPATKSKKARSAPVITGKVTSEFFRTNVEVVGTTRALQSVQIVAFSSGRLDALSITPGKTVKRGDVLAKLDDDIQRADLEEAKAKLEAASRAESSAVKLFRRRNIAEARVIELKSLRAIAEADVARAKRRLADRTIRAPFKGQTGMRRIDVGARVDTTTVLATLDNLSAIEVEAQISETIFPNIKIGTSVLAESAAFPGRTFRGSVTAIDKRIDPVSRAFPVRIRIPNKDRALPSGMFMRLTLQLNKRQRPSVSEEALVVDGDRKFIYVVDETGDTVRKAEVTIGRRTNGRIEIIEGLSTDVEIVTEGTHRLSDGAKIRIKAPKESKETKPASPTAELPASSQAARKKDGS